MLLDVELTAEDIVKTTPRYWQLQMDPILPMDGAATSLLIIHLNLCIGTLAKYAAGRPDLRGILKNLLNFETLCVFQNLNQLNILYDLVH